MLIRAKPQVNARVLDDYENRSLSPGRTYLVVGVDDEYFRVVDDAGDVTVQRAARRAPSAGTIAELRERLA